MRPAVDALEKSLKSFSFSKINKPMISSVSGCLLSSNEKIIPYFSDQLIQPVKFTNAVLTAQKTAPDLWIEIGPGNVLCGLVKNICGSDVVCCSTMEKNKDSLTELIPTASLFSNSFCMMLHNFSSLVFA